MKLCRKNSVLAHMLWEKKQETKLDFFSNLLKLQKETMQRKVEVMVQLKTKEKCDNSHIIH